MLFKSAELYNIAETVVSPGRQGWALCRYPSSVRERLDNPSIESPFFCAGTEIRFNIKSGSARIMLARDASSPVNATGICEVWFGPFQGDWQYSPRFAYPDGGNIEINQPDDIDELVALAKKANSPWDPRLVRLFLPYDYSCRLIDIEGDIAPPRPEQSPQKRILAYGSSITHGGSAVRPSEPWARRAADALGMDLINLGLAGTCRLEPAVAEWIAARRDWEVATLELGINLITQMDAAEFAERARRFLAIVGERRPDALIFCVDQFTNCFDVRHDAKIVAYRKAITEAVNVASSHNIKYVNGSDFLDPVSDLCQGLIHPSARGHEVIGKKMAEIIKERICEK
jgi:lysophospholipase L1-like esterase